MIVSTADLKKHLNVDHNEDDAYIATEIETDQGYTLLRDAISVEITAARSDRCAKCGAPLREGARFCTRCGTRC